MNQASSSVQSVEGMPNHPIQLPTKARSTVYTLMLVIRMASSQHNKPIDTGRCIFGRKEMGQQYQCVPCQIMHQEWQMLIRVLRYADGDLIVRTWCTSWPNIKHLFHTRPQDPGCYQVLCSPDASVWERMEMVKDTVSELGWYCCAYVNSIEV